MAGERQPDGSAVDGVIVHALSGLFRVAMADGRMLLCHPRGKLRGKGGAWRDNRDAERAEGVRELSDPDAEQAPEPDTEDAGPDAELLGRGDRRRLAAAGRGRGPGVMRATVHDEEEDAVPAVMAGDRVRCSDLGGGEGVIDLVLPRHSHLIRPPVANPDRVVVVVAWSGPPLSTSFVDRVVLEAALHGCDAAICLNKCDLLDADELAAARAALAPMAAAGYPLLFTSAVRGDGVDDLRALLRGQLAVLAGPSGAGKSHLLRALVPDSRERSAEISQRIGRGRHTTRAVHLLPLPGGGWLADTPGFSRLDLREAEVQDLPTLYPEFRPYQDVCRFRGCLHDTEPECAVRAAVASGRLDPDRYERYRLILTELRARLPRW